VPAETTVFDIDEVGVPPYSARGVTQTLEPISAQMRRTINGDLVDLGATQFRKYRSTVTCTDMDSPAIDGIWPGMTINVSCIPELAYPDATGSSPEKPVVSGSSRTADGFVFYRPKLAMKVTGLRIGKDEYGAACNWQMSLEEA
jgi:hypothetical protein